MQVGAQVATAITLCVADLKRSHTFDASVFGIEPVHQDADSVAFQLTNIVVNLL